VDVVWPLLFLDVDGPLIPFGLRSDGSAHRSLGRPGANPLLVRLDPDDGPRLLALRCELVWATTWMAEANEVIAPRLGLPHLPIVVWPDDPDDGTDYGPLHWKTRGLVSWAAGRPFVWLDDEITAADREWVATHHRAAALLHRVNPSCGLTGSDLATITSWLAGHERWAGVPMRIEGGGAERERPEREGAP
jgi:hypothetical protein